MKRFLLIVLLLPSLLFPIYSAASLNDIQQAEKRASMKIIDLQGDVFDQTYNLFSRQMNLGYRNLRNSFIPILLVTLIMLELLWICVQGILQKSLSVPEMLMKLFLVFVVIALMQNMDIIVEGLYKLFTRAGFVAAGGDSGTSSLGLSFNVGNYITFRPSTVTASCEQILEPLFELSIKLSGLISDLKFSVIDGSIWTSLPIAVPIWGLQALTFVVRLVLLVMIAFANINVLMWMIEFNFLLVVCTLVLPWQVFSPTKFMAAGIWQALFGQAIKMFCVVFIVGIACAIFDAVKFSTIDKLMNVVEGVSDHGYFVTGGNILILTTVITLTYCYMILKGPAIAKAIIVGQPTMETLGTHMVTSMGAKTLGTTTATVGGLAGLAAGGAGRLAGGLASVLNPFSQQNMNKRVERSQHRMMENAINPAKLHNNTSGRG